MRRGIRGDQRRRRLTRQRESNCAKLLNGAQRLRDDHGFGATGMFLSTFALALVSYYMFGRMKTNFFMVGLVAVFMLLLLIGRQFFRGLQYLVVDETAISSADTKPAIGATFESPALTTGQGTPIPIFGAQRVTTSEIVAPSSITEHTTNLLD